MERVVVITQSNFLPWIGYFDLISRSDVFVFLDDVQFTRQDWRNRNRIKTPQGLFWLTVPLHKEGSKSVSISEMKILDTDWRRAHLEAIRRSYRRSDFFGLVFPVVEEIYSYDCQALSELNQRSIRLLCDFQGFYPDFRHSSEFHTSKERSERLLDISQAVVGDKYLSAPRAKDYLNVQMFRDAGVEVEYMEYSYREYKQLWGQFQQSVSVLDPLFNLGPKALHLVRG